MVLGRPPYLRLLPVFLPRSGKPPGLCPAIPPTIGVVLPIRVAGCLLLPPGDVCGQLLHGVDRGGLRRPLDEARGHASRDRRISLPGDGTTVRVVVVSYHVGD